MDKEYKGPVEYSIEIAVETIEALLNSDYPISKRAMLPGFSFKIVKKASSIP